jgi:hypothetical protein
MDNLGHKKSKPLPHLEIDPLLEIPWDDVNTQPKPMEQVAKFNLTMAYSAMSLFYASEIQSMSRKQKSSVSEIRRPSFAEPSHHPSEHKTYNPVFNAVPKLAVPVPAVFTSDAISSRQVMDVVSLSSQSEINHPSQKDETPKDEKQAPGCHMSDQDLLKQAFSAAVKERRMGARSWISERNSKLE